MGSKKGQITLFIIIGLVIVLLAAAIFFFARVQQTQQLEEFVAPTLTEIPTAAVPVREFVQGCVEQVAEDGLRKIGDQGGYINSELMRARVFSQNPTESDAVAFSPNGDLLLPYWWYLKSPNTCTGKCEFASKRPNLYKTQGGVSIEGQLDNYINEQLPSCLNDFAALEGFTITSQGRIDTDTSVTRNSVAFLLRYPIEAQTGGETHTITEYFVQIPLNLQEMYDIGSEIANFEAEYQYLEGVTKNLLTGYSRLDADALPPFTDVELGLGSGTTWTKNDVENNVMSAITAYVPLIQVWGTQDYRWIEAPAQAGDVDLFETTYNRQMLVPLTVRHPDVIASFSYLDWWAPYFDLNCRGQVCGAETFTTNFEFLMFGLSRYNFAYDISYPVLVELRNPDAFDGRNGGFSLKFMLEQNLRNNDPLPEVFQPLSLADAAEAGTLLCDVGSRNSAPVTVNLIDTVTNQPTEGDVTFLCGTESCSLGTAVNGELTTPFPVCFGGIVSAAKRDYWIESAPLTTSLDEAREVTLELEPIRTVNVDVTKYLLKKGAQGWSVDVSNPVAHGANDSTFITLTRQGTPYDYPFTTSAQVMGDIFSTEEDFSEGINIIPGTYNVSITTMTFDDIMIPPQQRCVGSGDNEQCVFVPDEAIEFNEENPFPAGGAEFEWTVTADDLIRAETINFFTIYVAEKQVPESNREIEDITQSTNINQYSEANKAFLTPRIR